MGVRRLWICAGMLIGIITAIGIISVDKQLTFWGWVVAVITVLCCVIAVLYAWETQDDE